MSKGLNTPKGRARIGQSTVAAALLCLSLALGLSSARAETRGYVISWFATATNVTDFKANCPEDRNKGRIEWYIRDLVASGYTREEATKIIANASDSVQLPREVMQRMEGRAIVNGKHVSIYNYPDATEDPNIETVAGKFAYGFDLGSANQDNKFIDPDTHEKIDNQLWRAVGCLETFRAVPPLQPYPEGESWANEIDSAPGWALQISGDDLSKDGKVTVIVSLTTQHLERDARGQVMRGASYIIDDSPRSYNVLEGEIKNGVLSIKPTFFRIEGSRYNEIALRNAHMRIRSEGDKLVGYWGGFIKWRPFVYGYTSSPGSGADNIGMYHALKKMADAAPDPKTGQNEEISTTFRIEAVPAYLLQAEGRIVARPAALPLGTTMTADLGAKPRTVVATE